MATNISRVGLLAALICAQNIAIMADYDASIAHGILSSLEIELQAPWILADFDCLVIESGSAMTDNYTVVDADALKSTLFAGIKASRSAVSKPMIVDLLHQQP